MEEEQLLLAGARGYLKVLILLLVDAGLRVGKEALPLKWKDLDLTNEVVHVRESKTLAGIRSIPLTDRLRTQLVQWRHMTGPECSEFVFFYPLNPSKHLQKVPKSWARALKKAGIPYTRIYDLRATFSTRLNVVGIEQVIVDQLLGHSGGLAQTYTKAIEEIRRDAIATLNPFVNARLRAKHPQEIRARGLTDEREERVVGLGRVELPTYGLGNRRSIHLSYSPVADSSMILFVPICARNPFRIFLHEI